MSSIEILLVVILSCAAFCYGLVKLVTVALRGLGTLLGMGSASRRVDDALHDRMLRQDPRGAMRRGGRCIPVRTVASSQRHVCPGADCRHVNVSEARFSAQCGRRLSA
jgi:hypothetical protein